MVIYWDLYRYIIWLVVTGTWLAYDFPFSWECHHPNWRAHIFQRGSNHQPDGNWWEFCGKHEGNLWKTRWEMMEMSWILCLRTIFEGDDRDEHPFIWLPARLFWCEADKGTRFWPIPILNGENDGGMGNDEHSSERLGKINQERALAKCSKHGGKMWCDSCISHQAQGVLLR